MKEDPEINEFIEAMLSEIGFADGDGRFKTRNKQMIKFLKKTTPKPDFFYCDL